MDTYSKRKRLSYSLFAYGYLNETSSMSFEISNSIRNIHSERKGIICKYVTLYYMFCYIESIHSSKFQWRIIPGNSLISVKDIFIFSPQTYIYIYLVHPISLYSYTLLVVHTVSIVLYSILLFKYNLIESRLDIVAKLFTTEFHS